MSEAKRKAAPPQGGCFNVEGRAPALPPQVAGRGDVPSVEILHSAFCLIPPLSGGSAPYLICHRSGGSAPPKNLEAEWAGRCGPPQTASLVRRGRRGRPSRPRISGSARGGCLGRTLRRAFPTGPRKRPPSGGRSRCIRVGRAQLSFSSSPPSPAGATGSDGTVTFSGVTSPGMNVMSTSSPGSPSSFILRATRIVEPGSS